MEKFKDAFEKVASTQTKLLQGIFKNPEKTQAAQKLLKQIRKMKGKVPLEKQRKAVSNMAKKPVPGTKPDTTF